MIRLTYKKIRPVMHWFVIATVSLVVVILVFTEITTPPTIPPITKIISTAPPQTEPPSPSVQSSYTVPADQPKHLIVDKLGINTNILPMDVTKEGAIDAPRTAWDVGWYKDSTKPGSGSGAALIDGHVNDAFNTPGVFSEILNLATGDTIIVIRGDDTQLVYAVVSVAQQSLESVDMSTLLRSVDADKEGLTLITCGGVYDRSRQTFRDRVVIHAVRVS